MLVFNLKRVFKMRDIERPYSFLRKRGFGHMTASKYAHDEITQPHLANIEMLCRVLHCTPNDLFEWVPETGSGAIDDAHPLNALKREKNKGLSELIKEVPLEKLPELEEFIKTMK